MISDDARRLLTLCAARVDGKSPDWSLLARRAGAGELEELAAGIVSEPGPAAGRTRKLLREALIDQRDAIARVDAELEAADQVDARLVTVLDDDYPANLRLVHDLPPFLFIRGTLRREDLKAVAVVGTRSVSDTGLSRARRMASELVGHGVTVTSGLAKGVDTAAHTAALDAGGRTIAVMGTGITRCYPAENRELAERIVKSGALVSQFWPTRAPGRDTFPRRNRVTSGISQGTVVIEASSTSGAKMQARLASEHGKQVWLIQSLVTSQPWAQAMVADGRAREVSSTSEVLEQLQDPDTVTASAQPALQAADTQLALDL
ncbi:MAG: DNA-processing protein DprA [Nocardioides sp.]